MALKDVLNPTVEPFHHTVGLRRHRWCQAVVDIQLGTKPVELMPAIWVGKTDNRNSHA
jgi:hypothetical protein